MKRIIVTPAGRKRYLKVLLQNLIKCKDEFDHWNIWINTKNQEDIDFILEIEKNYDFITAVQATSEINTEWPGASIHQFFKGCIDENSLYLRLDDDIVFIKKGSIENIFTRRQNTNSNFLLYGNTLNNVLMSHLQQKCNNVPVINNRKAGYSPFDLVGWQDGNFAEELHRLFFERYKNQELAKFNLPDWVFSDYEHVSINCICWRGDEFKKFGGIVDPDEERWLTTVKTREVQKPNMIIGDTLFVHYAYYTQRPHMETTDILSLYEKI
jgi:hypothetical protein